MLRPMFSTRSRGDPYAVRGGDRRRQVHRHACLYRLGSHPHGRLLGIDPFGRIVAKPLKCVSGWITGLSYRAPTAVTRARVYFQAHTGSDGGMRQKASDYSCIPLCANCHTQGPQAYHPIGRAAFAARWKLDVPDLERGVARGAGERGVRSARIKKS